MASSSVFQLLLFFIGFSNISGASDFRICAFNLHNFGDSKSKKTEVMQVLVKVITRCDVCLLQEVRDSKGKALPELMEQIKRSDRRHRYQAVSSQRLGRGHAYQEQYVFVYRTDSAVLADQYQYPDERPGDVDAFSREPFVVRFRAPRTAIREFVLIPQHTSPSNATKELDALYDVLLQVVRMWRTKDVMLLGDFNADCGYLAKKNRKKVRLLTDPDLVWLIPEDTDTTVRSSTTCSYDHIVVYGEAFFKALVPSSAGVFDFQKAYGLTEDQALDVSDHFPVEVLLRVESPRSLGGAGSLTSVLQSVSLFSSLIAGRLLV